MQNFVIQIAMRLHRFYSTYVVYIITGIALWWMQLPAVDQTAILAEYPKLRLVAPLMGLFAFLIARGWPQPTVAPVSAVVAQGDSGDRA